MTVTGSDIPALRGVGSGALRRAFTLVEILIVMSLMLVLAGIALPTAKELLSDQKATRAARTIATYIAQARSEAVGKGQHIGVRIERLAATENVDYGSTAAVRLQRIAGVPPYSGEVPNARVRITGISFGIASLEFDPADSLLVTLHESNDAPVGDGDLIEFPGGKTFPLNFITPYTAGNPVAATIDLNKPDASATETFPLGHQVPSSGRFAYRIHRAPKVSASNPLSFSRGLAIDLNYSGIGLVGNQFAPTPLTSPAVNQPIDILFGPDGSVSFVSIDNQGNVGPAIGMIYLCLGTADGVVEPPDPTVAATTAELFENSDQFRANITNPDSIWIVINPNTGRVVTAPFASVPDVPATVGEGLTTARGLAILSDTLDTAP